MAATVLATVFRRDLLQWLRQQLDIDEQAAEMVDGLRLDLPEPPAANEPGMVFMSPEQYVNATGVLSGDRIRAEINANGAFSTGTHTAAPDADTATLEGTAGNSMTAPRHVWMCWTWRLHSSIDPDTAPPSGDGDRRRERGPTTLLNRVEPGG